MKKEEFTQAYYPLALRAGSRFGMNPAMILAQAAMESAWGESYGARVRKNFFGITASGPVNEFWDGSYSVSQNVYRLKFRVYKSEQDSFYDFARLIKEAYPTAHQLSYDSTAYAHSIANSPYISEKNGDNRDNYMKGILSSFQSISEIIKKKDLN